jgi:ABC-2 type transport system ATP-binding protein
VPERRSAPVISCDAVVHRYGRRTALSEVTWVAEPGLTGMLGRNGAGKTTLLRIITTLIRPTSGRVSVAGLDSVRDAAAVRGLLGYLPQEFQPYLELSVREYLSYVGYLAHLPPAVVRRELERVVTLTNLDPVIAQRVGALSGGTRRRLGIAQALLGKPPILVVDEPTAGLDVEERVRLRQLLAELAQESTVLMSTHLVEDLEALAGRLLVIERGRVLFDGSTTGLSRKAEGHVFEIETNSPTPPEHDMVVVRAVPTGNRFRLRVVSPKSTVLSGALPASLEDGYLMLLAEEAA